jgi:hypothetical protein
MDSGMSGTCNTHWGMKNAFRILVANTTGKTHFGFAWEDNIKMDFKETWYGVQRLD